MAGEHEDRKNLETGQPRSDTNAAGQRQCRWLRLAYGLGLAIKSVYEDTNVFHYGGTLGYWNSLQHFRKADRTILVLTNNESEKGITNAIDAILFGKPVAMPSMHKEIKLSPSGLNEFVGTFEANGRSFSIEKREGKLFRIVEGSEPIELKAESMSKLYYTGVDRQVEFVFGRGRKLKQAFFTADWIKLELKRTKQTRRIDSTKPSG